MSADWPEVRLEDITSILGDGLHGTPKYERDGEYFFINGNNLSNGKIVFNEKTKRASREEYLKYKKELNERTVLVSINGTLGNVAFYNGEKVFLGKSACYFNVVDDIDKKFVRYVISSKLFQDYIITYATGTTIKNVSLKSMRDFIFRLPPINEQKQISKVLGDLDDKVELNRQINQTLESMAQAIFKNWFVDFDPVKAKIAALESGKDAEGVTCAAMRAISGKTNDELDKMEGGQPENYAQLKTTAELFPAAMQDSELGEVPEGWEDGNFKDCCERVESGGTPKRSEESYWGGEIKWLASGEVRDVIVLDTKEKITKKGLENSSAKLWPEGTTIVAMYGATAGQVCMISSEMSANQACCALIPKPECRSYIFFSARNAVLSLSDRASGSAQQNLNKSLVANHECLIPEIEVLEQFEKSISPFLNKWRYHDIESANLSQLRDTLLPKLLSGELSVDAVKLAEEN